LIVASGAGGGTDTSGRLIATFLAGHLPGKPNVVVRNIPGAQGITAMNHFVQQIAPDGLTLTMGSTTQADPLLYRKPQSQYDPTKFGIIGGAGRGGTVLLIRKDAEARLYDKKAAPVIMGALSGVPRSGMQMTAWGIELLGWNAKWVLGYPGTNELFVALERGEIDMTTTANLFQIQKLLQSGNFKLISQTGTMQKGKTMGRPEFGDAPMFAATLQSKLKETIEQKAYDYWASLTALDKWVALPPNTPDAYLDAYRDAFNHAFEGTEFSDLGKRISEDFEPMSGQDVEFLIGRLGATPPEAVAYINTMLRRQGLGVE
jgi:tripartite-type tricarboxylate transporter receptor subunit TctC